MLPLLAEAAQVLPLLAEAPQQPAESEPAVMPATSSTPLPSLPSTEFARAENVARTFAVLAKLADIKAAQVKEQDDFNQAMWDEI